MENENVKTENEKAPRTCSHCGAGMFAGYCIDGGGAYYCSDACLHANMTPAEYAELHDDGRGESYWTEWPDDDDDDDAPDPKTCELHDAISYAMGSLEAEALDVLDECAERYTRELAAARAELAAARSLLQSCQLALDLIPMKQLQRGDYSDSYKLAAALGQYLRGTTAQDFAEQPGVLALRVQFTPADDADDDAARAALKNDFDLYLQSLAHGGLPDDVKNARMY